MSFALDFGTEPSVDFGTGPTEAFEFLAGCTHTDLIVYLSSPVNFGVLDQSNTSRSSFLDNT
jgi:hypothetical protein